MRNLLLILLMPLIGYSQTIISDDFSDGNFTTSPTWSGDTASFEVDTNRQLHLIDSLAGDAYLSATSGIIKNASWEFLMKMEFNPSSSNFAKVYLVSDQPDLSGPLNGYFVRIGGSSADRISLYQQSGSNTSLIAESSDDWVDLSVVEAGIKVSRDSTGFWVLTADTGGGTNYTPIDSATENTHTTSSHFGLSCTYTKTRSDLFFFDDFYLEGEIFSDTKPPKVSRAEVLSQTSLRIIFSEAVEKTTAETLSNYEVDGGIGSPVAAIHNSSDPREVELQFPQNFQNRTTYQLFADGVEDDFGNPAQDTAQFSYYQPEVGDIIINELMPDPNPVIGIPPNALPEREYVELYNRTTIPIELKGWALTVGSSVEVLPTYTLPANGYVVFTKDEGVGEFPSGLPIVGLDMSAVALTNSGNTVSLEAPSGLLVNSLSYTDDWYADPNKDGGGWSLELIDPDNRCGGRNNWRASEDPIGGTPGLPNSVLGSNPDTLAPAFARIAIPGDSSIVVYFTETVDDTILRDMATYRIQPALPLDSIHLLAPAFDRVELFFAEEIDPQSIYELSLTNLPFDCSNNQMLGDTLIFTIPARPEVGEILINEILFNPPAGGSDFVEIYNNSDKLFDLSKLRLANYDAALQTVVNLKEISEESFLLEPGRYMAFTNDAGFLLDNYTVKIPANLLETAESLPGMSDGEGSIAVVTSDLTTMVDRFEYTDDLHLAVLDDDEGVSLERISFDKPTSDDDNWQSAAATAGYATPGHENSQYGRPQPSGEISLEPKVFSPNQDGYRDVLNIVYNFKNANNILSISIWSPEGYEVRKLQESVNVSQTGFFTWDGTNANGQLQNSGIYIVVLEYFNQNGDSEVMKETCVLSR